MSYYAASSGHFLLTFRDNLSVPSSGWTLKMGPIGCSETSIRNVHNSLRNDPEERSSQCITMFYWCADKLQQKNYKRELSADGKTILSLNSISCCVLPMWSCRWNLLHCPWPVISALWSGSKNSVMAAHFCLSYGKSVLKIKCAFRLSLQNLRPIYSSLRKTVSSYTQTVGLHVKCQLPLSGFKESCVLHKFQWYST